MAGLVWLTVRHRPSEPRFACENSLAHRLTQSGQRRWVRGRHAAIRGRRQWVRLIRVDRVSAVMADAPYDHNDAGAFRRHCVSVWQVPAVGAEFASLRDAAAWIAAMPG
jgi:uncharacterized protein (DUF1697 family)